MPSDSRALGDYFKDFSTTTVIRVFNFIRMSHFLAERLFWITILVGFSFMTILNVTQTLQSYAAEPTASHLEFISNASSGFNFSDANICIEISSENLLKLYGANVSIDTDPQKLLENLKKKLEKIHDREDERAALLMSSLRNVTASDDYGVPLVLYQSFEKSTIEAFTEEDLTLFSLTTSMLVRLTDQELNPLPFYPRWQSQAVERLYAVYVQQKTNFGELFNLVADMACVLHQIRVVVRRLSLPSRLLTYTSYNFCKHSRGSPHFFGVDPLRRMQLICFRPLSLPAPFVFYSNGDYVTLTMHPEALYKEFTPQLESIQLDFAGTMAVEQQPILSTMFNQKEILVFSLEVVSNSLSLRRRGCLEKSSRKGVHFQCVLWCRVESIIDACGCIPLVQQFLPDFSKTECARLPSCSEVSEKLRSERCLHALSSQYDRRNCSQECFSQNCETLLFASSTPAAADVSLLDEINATTVVRLMMSKFIFLKVDEHLAMDVKAVVAVLGGNLNLYLGASFLAFIHIIIFFVKLPFQLALGQREQPAVIEMGTRRRRRMWATKGKALMDT